MRAVRRLAILALALAVCAPGTPRLDRHRWVDALEVRTKHFVVETNTFPELARSLSARLEEAYPLFTDRFGPLRDQAARRMRISLYRTQAEYLKRGDGVQGAVGHFDAALDRCALAWRGSRGATGWPIAVHEASHHYFRRKYKDIALPSWYSEGIACYFEGLQDPTTKRGIARSRVAAARAGLATGDADLERLLLARTRIIDGALRLEGFLPVRYYALSWSLVHFLASHPRYRRRFRRFEMRLFAAPPPAGERESHARRLLIEECGPLAAIERDWRLHLAALDHPRAARTPPCYPWELTSDNPWVRYHALHRLLGRPLTRDIENGVRRCLRDSDLIVRTIAARVMSQRVDAPVAEVMIRNLDLGDPGLKRIAIQALGTPAARAAVPRLIRERDDRPGAVAALAAIGDPRGFPTLRLALLDRLTPSNVRARCAAALCADPGSRSILKLATIDPSRLVRNAAEAALLRLEAGRKEPKETRTARALKLEPVEVDLLLETLSSATSDPREKAHACGRLSLAREKRAVSALRRLCASREPDFLRLAAVRALVNITGETQGFQSGQTARERELVFRRWADG